MNNFVGAQRPGREQRPEELKLGIPNSERGSCRRRAGSLADCHRPALNCRGQKVTKVVRGQLRVSFSDGITAETRGMCGFQGDNEEVRGDRTLDIDL